MPVGKAQPRKDPGTEKAQGLGGGALQGGAALSEAKAERAQRLLHREDHPTRKSSSRVPVTDTVEERTSPSPPPPPVL